MEFPSSFNVLSSFIVVSPKPNETYYSNVKPFKLFEIAISPSSLTPVENRSRTNFYKFFNFYKV